MDYEMKLDMLAHVSVTRGEYPEPTPTIEGQIEAKKNEIREYKSGKVTRPQPKSAYTELLAELDAELVALNEQNDSIIAGNQAARKAVDDKYTADIEAFKENEVNQWNAIRAQRNAILTTCDWTQTPDSPKYQDVGWVKYRQALRDITKQTDPYKIVWPVEPTEPIKEVTIIGVKL